MASIGQAAWLCTGCHPPGQAFSKQGSHETVPRSEMAPGFGSRRRKVLVGVSGCISLRTWCGLDQGERGDASLGLSCLTGCIFVGSGVAV